MTKSKHIEVEGCIVNIRTGLHDSAGHKVTSVEVICDQYAGEPKWSLPDLSDARTFNVRVVQGNDGSH